MTLRLARFVVFALVLALVVGAASAGGSIRSDGVRADVPAAAVSHDTSPPLRTLQPAQSARPAAAFPARPVPHQRTSAGADGITQSSFGTQSALATLTSFDGVGEGFSGPTGGFAVSSAPPDTNAAVGPNHVVQMVNSDFAIFTKTGTAIYGPVPTNTLWAAFGGGCQTNNDGDGSVTYDRLADRWVISQFSVSTAPYLECVAVSQTADPTGAWYRYAFSYGNTDFPDYPKIGVWPDAYYTTFNIFPNSATFSGARVCAYDRASMLAGRTATQQCFNTSSAWGGLLPATVDSATPPPAGAPDPVAAFGTNDLGIWHFHVDWATPANSTFTGPSLLPVASFTDACNDGTCIPQAGTTQKLDSLGDRLMQRLAYRNFGDHEAMVVNHSITAGSSVGVRWYELRESGAVGSRTTSLFQQGTYAPDSAYRWMGSAAMDGAGDIALGYSHSSASDHPGIRYTARLASDPAGQMTQGEGTIITGAGSQSGSRGLTRWGDYSSLVVDPSDDCTFWYTNEYEATTGEYNWHTRIGSFKVGTCGALPSNDFSISASPSTVTAVQGGSGTSTISTSAISGSAETLVLSASGLPAGATASFNPSSVSTGGSSTLTLGAGTAAPGSYTVTVTAAGPSATHSATVDFTVQAAPDFAIAAAPASQSVVQGGGTSYSVTITPQNGFASPVSLAASGVPAGATGSFSPNPTSSSSTLTVTTAAATPAGSYVVTITGTSGGISHSTTVDLVVQAPADFSISASPASASAARGTSAGYTITVTALDGFNGSVSLSPSGVPKNVTASFDPNPTPSSATLTLATKKNAKPGTYTVTITGTSGSRSHTTSVTLTVTR